MTAVPLRYIAAVNETVLPENTPPDFAFKYIDISQVDGNSKMTIPIDVVTFDAAPSRARRVAAVGSTVVSTVRTYLRAIGTVPDSEEPLIFSTGFAVLTPTQGDPRYFGYACRSDNFVQEVVSRSVGVSYPAISPADLMDISLPSPDLEEQRRIADFLDDRVACIDRIVGARRLQSDLVGALGASQLERMVYDLRQTVRSRRLATIASVRSGEFLPSTEFDDGGPVPVYGGNGVTGRYRVANTVRQCVVVGRVGALCGNVHLLPESAWVTDNALVVRLRDPVLMPAYVAAVLHAANLNSVASQTAQPLLTGTQVGDWPIPLATRSEQEKLVAAWQRSATAGTDSLDRSR